MRFFLRHTRRRAVIEMNQERVLYIEKDHYKVFYKTMKINKFKKKYPDDFAYFQDSEKTTLKTNI